TPAASSLDLREPVPSRTADRRSRIHAMASPDRAVRSLTADELAALATGELLALSRAILAELRHREVIRSGNAPAGRLRGTARPCSDRRRARPGLTEELGCAGTRR